MTQLSCHYTQLRVVTPGMLAALVPIMRDTYQVAEDLLGSGVSLSDVLAFAAVASESSCVAGDHATDSSAPTVRPGVAECPTTKRSAYDESR